MTRFASLSALSLLLLVALVMSSCGNGRRLQSVTISPASADAKNYPNGQVPFIATGTFSKPPSPVQLTSKDVLWCYGGSASVANPTAGLCAGNIAQFATVDQNGVAQCAPSFQGTAYILAGTAEPSMNPDAGLVLKIFGQATLTCP